MLRSSKSDTTGKTVIPIQSLHPDFLSQKTGIAKVLGGVYLSLDSLELVPSIQSWCLSIQSSWMLSFSPCLRRLYEGTHFRYVKSACKRLKHIKKSFKKLSLETKVACSHRADVLLWSSYKSFEYPNKYTAHSLEQCAPWI